MSSMSNTADVQRKGWDTAAFERRAKERERAEKEAEHEKLRSRKAARQSNNEDADMNMYAPSRAWLRKRDHVVDFESKIGTTEIVSSVQGAGFHCKVCDVTLKDSNRFLSHINSRAHQKQLGMSMRVRRSTVEEIERAFQVQVEKLRSLSAANTCVGANSSPTPN